MIFNRLTLKMTLPILALALASTAPAFAQNRFMDEAKASADRRAENKAVREAEHPDATKPAATTTTASTAAPVPAETAPAAQTAVTPAPAAPVETPAAATPTR